MDCSLLGSSVHGILQARILEWVAISFSRGSSWARDRTWVFCIGGRCFNLWATREAPSMWDECNCVVVWALFGIAFLYAVDCNNSLWTFHFISLALTDFPSQVKLFNTATKVTWGFPGGSVVRNPPAMQESQEIQVWILDWEDPLEEGMAKHSSVLAWRIP